MARRKINSGDGSDIETYDIDTSNSFIAKNGSSTPSTTLNEKKDNKFGTMILEKESDVVNFDLERNDSNTSSNLNDNSDDYNFDGKVAGERLKKDLKARHVSIVYVEGVYCGEEK